MSEGDSQPGEAMTVETESQGDETETSKLDTSAETPTPKKRGRPPGSGEGKKITKETTPEPASAEKRKRGRPPKPKPEPFVVPDSEEVKPEKPDSMVTDSDEAKSVPQTPDIPVKRGRGRPRKTPPSIGPPEPAPKPSTSLEKVPKKRGRPRKSDGGTEEDSAKKKQKLNDDDKPKKREDVRQRLKFRSTRNSTDNKAKKNAGSDFPHRVNVSVGADASTGPGFYRSVSIVNCTLSSEQLSKAYRDGSAKLGFDLQKEICTTNYNCALSVDHFKKLVASGIPVLDGDGEGEDPGLDFELTLDSYRDIWLHIARLGNPSLVWSVAEFDALPIGGNGLFDGLVDQRDAKPETEQEKPESLSNPEIVQ